MQEFLVRRRSRVGVVGVVGVAAGAAVVLAAVGVSSADAETGGPLGLLRPRSAVAAPVVSAVTGTTAGVSGGSRLEVRGSGLGGVTTLVIGGHRVAPATRTASTVRFVLPEARDFRAARVPYRLLAAPGTVVRTGAVTYRVRSGRDRQLQYVLRYWKHYNPAYDALDGNDCVDFTSQSLLARGWRQQGEWTHAEDVLDSGLAWRSSTSLRDFLLAHPSRAVPLTDAQRARVRLGDVVQFDWDRSGDRDHTGVVTRITRSGGHIRIFFAGHTKDSAYRSVDTAITKEHPGGRAYYFSVR